MSTKNTMRNRSAGNHTRDLPDAMSQADWKALGEMGRVRGAAENTFDNAWVDDQGEYDGSDEPKREVDRDYAPHMFLDTTTAMGNPNRKRDMPDYDAGHSMWQHYERVLSRGDDSTINLLQAAARAGNRMSKEAALHRVGGARVEDSSYREALLDTRAARTGEQAADMAEEAASSAAARARNVSGGGDWTLIAGSTDEAKIARRVIDYALTLMPADGALSSQKLIYSPSELPPKSEMLAVLNEVRPSLYRDMTDAQRIGDAATAGKAQNARQTRKAVAIIASAGAENAALGQLRGVDRSIAVIPGASKTLWKAMIDAKDNHWRVTVPFVKPDAEGKYPKNAGLIHNENVINAADRVIVAWNGRDDDDALTAAAYAARVGKLEAIVDDRGNLLNRAEASDHAMTANPSRAEVARARSAGVFDIPADSPEARFALTLVRPFRSAGLSSSAIDAVANAASKVEGGMTLREMSEMARDPQGAQELLRTHKIAIGTIRILADDKSMANAREAYKRIKEQCDDKGVYMVGRQDMPAQLAKDPNAPQVLFVKGGNPDELRSMTNVVAMMGDANPLPHMARRGAELAVAMDRPGVTLLQVEDQGLPRFTPENASLLLLASGHEQFGPRAHIEWNAPNDKGVEKAEARTGAFAVVPSKSGEKLHLMYLAAGADRSETKTLATADVPPGGRPVDQPFGEIDKKEAQRRAVWGAAIEVLKTTALHHEQEILNRPTREFRDSFIQNGGMVISAMPPVESTSVYSTVSKSREAVPAIRTPESETKAIEIAARLADVTVITQSSTKGPMNTALSAISERHGKVVVVSPPQEIAAFDEVGGNIAMARMPGKDLPNVMALTGDRALAIRQEYGDRKLAVSTGQHMDSAALKIADALGLPAPAKVQAAPETAVETAVATRKFEVERKKNRAKTAGKGDER